jgi:hypothetical protein
MQLKTEVSIEGVFIRGKLISDVQQKFLLCCQRPGADLINNFRTKLLGDLSPNSIVMESANLHGGFRSENMSRGISYLQWQAGQGDSQ